MRVEGRRVKRKLMGEEGNKFVCSQAWKSSLWMDKSQECSTFHTIRIILPPSFIPDYFKGVRFNSSHFVIRMISHWAQYKCNNFNFLDEHIPFRFTDTSVIFLRILRYGKVKPVLLAQEARKQILWKIICNLKKKTIKKIPFT
jgi:hypothetical protein